MSHDPREQRVDVNKEEAVQIYNMFRRDPLVFMCRQLLVSLLLSNGIQVQQKNTERGEMTSEFQRLFDEHWVPFTRDLIDAFFMFGYCPWLTTSRSAPTSRATKKRRRKTPSERVDVPIVPQFGTYDIQCVVDQDYSQRLEFVPRNTTPTGIAATDDRVQILVSSDGSPSLIDGSHTSLGTTLLPKYRIMQHLYRGTLRADHLRSHPSLLTQDTQDKSHLNDTLAEEPFGDPVEILADIDERRYKRNESDMKILQDKRRLAATNNRQGSNILDPFGGPGGEVIERSQAFHDNLFHLPDGTQVAPQPTLPPIRNDLMEIERERASVVCGCFGVPQSLLLPGSSRKPGGGSSENDIQQLMRTVGAVAANITRALTDVYTTIYPDEKEEITITLSIVPLASIEHLITIYEQGVISKETQGRHLIRAVGLPETVLDITNAKRMEEERRAAGEVAKRATQSYERGTHPERESSHQTMTAAAKTTLNN